jgi:membrane fusion protein (multidrug efflux system)
MEFMNIKHRKQTTNRQVQAVALRTTVTIAALMACFTLVSCGKKDDAAAKAAGKMPPMPVTVIELQATTVPISAETVAQTEGAKEVEIRPRVGGILLKKLFEEGAPMLKHN